MNTQTPNFAYHRPSAGIGIHRAHGPESLAVVSKGSPSDTILVGGGDVGRGLVLQCSTNLTNARGGWNTCSQVGFIASRSGVPTAFTVPATNRNSFYRIMTTNTPPTY